MGRATTGWASRLEEEEEEALWLTFWWESRLEEEEEEEKKEALWLTLWWASRLEEEMKALWHRGQQKMLSLARGLERSRGERFLRAAAVTSDITSQDDTGHTSRHRSQHTS